MDRPTAEDCCWPRQANRRLASMQHCRESRAGAMQRDATRLEPWPAQAAAHFLRFSSTRSMLRCLLVLGAGGEGATAGAGFRGAAHRRRQLWLV